MSEQEPSTHRGDQDDGTSSVPNPPLSAFTGKRPSRKERLQAWGVHLFTAMGIVFALLALIAVSDRDWREVFLWLFLALVVDGVDGTLARRARVIQVLPEVNGKMIDSVIDFTTYALVPAFFFYQAGLAPPGWGLICASVMLLSAVLYYGKEGMISDSMHFVGFPVLWNVFVFFDFFIFVLPGWANVLLVFFFAVLHFVPIKFAYPSRATRWQGFTLFISLIALFAAALIIIEYPERSFALRTIVVVAAAYFIGLALWETYGEE